MQEPNSTHADNLEHIALVRLYGRTQDSVVTRLGSGPCFRPRPRQSRAALDVRKEESNGAGWD